MADKTQASAVDAGLSATHGSQTPAAGGRTPSAAGSEPARRKAKPNYRQAIEAGIFIAPALALFAFFVVWPMIKAVQFSLYRWKGFGPLVDFVGLDNYIRVLQNDVFIGSLTHNLIIIVASIAIQLPLGLLIALLLNRKMWGRAALRTIVFVPYVLAEVIVGVIWFQMLQPNYGAIAVVLDAVGIQGPPQGFLGTVELALPTLMVVLTWKFLGFAIILFLAGLQGVPEELHEAAQIDGASWWQTQVKITIPLIGPTLRTWAFLSMVGSLQLFDMVWILTKGGPANATTTMVTFLINEGTKRSNYGIASAASVVLFIIALVFALVYQRFILRRDNPDIEPQRKKVTR